MNDLAETYREFIELTDEAVADWRRLCGCQRVAVRFGLQILFHHVLDALSRNLLTGPAARLQHWQVDRLLADPSASTIAYDDGLVRLHLMQSPTVPLFRLTGVECRGGRLLAPP